MFVLCPRGAFLLICILHPEQTSIYCCLPGLQDRYTMKSPRCVTHGWFVVTRVRSSGPNRSVLSFGFFLLGLEVIALRLEAIAIRLEAIALRLEPSLLGQRPSLFQGNFPKTLAGRVTPGTTEHSAVEHARHTGALPPGHFAGSFGRG